MKYTKPMVTIELEEYQDLKAKEKELEETDEKLTDEQLGEAFEILMGAATRGNSIETAKRSLEAIGIMMIMEDKGKAFATPIFRKIKVVANSEDFNKG